MTCADDIGAGWRLSIRQRAIGSLLHLVQDSYSPAHTIRRDGVDQMKLGKDWDQTVNFNEDAKQNLGAIIQISNYNDQVTERHLYFDTLQSGHSQEESFLKDPSEGPYTLDYPNIIQAAGSGEAYVITTFLLDWFQFNPLPTYSEVLTQLTENVYYLNECSADTLDGDALTTYGKQDSEQSTGGMRDGRIGTPGETQFYTCEDCEPAEWVQEEISYCQLPSGPGLFRDDVRAQSIHDSKLMQTNPNSVIEERGCRADGVKCPKPSASGTEQWNPSAEMSAWMNNYPWGDGR